MVVACSPARTARGRSRSSTATDFATKFGCEVKGWDASEVVRQARAQAPRSLPAVRRRRRDDGGRGRGPRHEGSRRAGASLGQLHRRGPRRRADDRGHLRGDEREGPAPRLLAVLRHRHHHQRGCPAWCRSAPARPAPNISHVSACATGAHSIGEAMRAIRHGYADGMIAGGAEATISILGVGGFNAMRAMSTRNDAPEKASRPFDKDRDGFVIGEGAGIVVLEDLETREEARRADLRRAHRLRREQRRSPHRGAGARAQAARRRASASRSTTRSSIRARSATSTRTAPRPTSTTRTRRSRRRSCSATTRRSSRCRRPSR